MNRGRCGRSNGRRPPKEVGTQSRRRVLPERGIELWGAGEKRGQRAKHKQSSLEPQGQMQGSSLPLKGPSSVFAKV